MTTINALRRPTLLLFVASLCAAVFAACSPDDPFIAAERPVVVQKKGAWLRVIHAAPDDPAILVRVGDSLLFQQPQHYLQFSASIDNEAKYYPVDTAAHSIKFTLGDGSVVVQKSDVKFVEDQYYTVYLYGKGNDHRLLFTSDSIEPPAATDPKPAKLRVVNLGNDAPAITVRLENPTSTPIVDGLPYGQASDYIRTKEYSLLNGGTGLFISESPSNKLLFFVPTGFPLLSGLTVTVVIAGNSKPVGDELFLQFNALLESTRSDDSLRGSPGFGFALGAQRLVNITNSGDSSVDATLLETRGDIKPEFVFNDFYRRTQYSAAHFFVDRIPSLGNPAIRWTRPYRYESILINQTWTYRIEYFEEWGPQPSSVPNKPQGTPTIDYRKQHVLAGPTSFLFQQNKRYTFVAYGQYDATGKTASGKTVTLVDNTTQAPGGMAQVRLFHGAFGELESKKLRLRINGATTPVGVGYGEATAGTNSVAVSAGAVTAEVIDESGNVLHTQELITDPNSHTGLEAGKSYTIFLSRGYKGDTLYLHPLSEELLLE